MRVLHGAVIYFHILKIHRIIHLVGHCGIKKEPHRHYLHHYHNVNCVRDLIVLELCVSGKGNVPTVSDYKWGHNAMEHCTGETSDAILHSTT